MLKTITRENNVEALSDASKQSPRREKPKMSRDQSPASLVELGKRLERFERRDYENYTRLRQTLILVGSGIFLATLFSNLWPLFL